ncbi:ABC transporter ATP-binding protein/permease [Amycolatopsis sp. NBC_00345]|uniref:ABC transporter ATP-binding protein n=1 Tax=Amycolatopsis sp. NBC_00345 TaxID=2975955 RepID=UPI002E26BB8C
MPSAIGAGRRRMLLWLVLVGVAQSTCVVAFAVLLRVLVDHVEHPARTVVRQVGIYAPIERWSTSWLLIALAVTSAVTVLLKALSPPMGERLAQSYVHAVRVRLFDHVSGSQNWAADRRAVGVTVLRFTGDSAALRNWAGEGVAALVVDGVFVVCTMGVLAVMLPAAGAAAAGWLVICLGVALLFGRALRSRVREARRQTGRLASFVNERVTYAAVMQSLGRIRRERRLLSRHSRRFSEAMVRQAGSVGRLVATAEAARIGIVVAVIGAAVEVGARADVITSLVSIAGFLGGPLVSLTQAQEAWQRSKIARLRITEVIGTPALLSPPEKAPKLADGPGRLELVDLRLPGVRSGADAVVEPGQRVALHGPPGAGKSLLLAVIARLHSADGGSVLLDGQDLATHDPASVGRAIRLVTPDLPLLRGTVRVNLGHGNVPQRDLDESTATRLDALAAFQHRLETALAESLPHGLATRVGEGGHGLSRAGRYQVSLARALRGAPRVLLLDWPASETALAEDLLDELFDSYPGVLVCVTGNADLPGRADLHWSVEAETLTVHKACHPIIRDVAPPLG